MQQLERSPELVERIERVTAGSLAEQLASSAPPSVIDVRTSREWSEGHIDGATNLPLAQLHDRMDEIPSDTPVVVYCSGGYRSAIASSLLRKAGLREVTDLVGGLGAWESSRTASVG
jgi:rhodanese-related sulfurtransferase